MLPLILNPERLYCKEITNSSAQVGGIHSREAPSMVIGPWSHNS